MCIVPSQSRNPFRSVYVNVDTVEDLASFLHDSAEIDTDSRIIYFGPGAGGEKLMEVPIGRVCEDNTVVIKVGVVKEYLNTDEDRDPKVGIADESGTHTSFRIQDVNNYRQLSPCHVFSNRVEDNKLVSEGTIPPATFKFTFHPRDQYAACETAQEGGYSNTGRHRAKLDLTKPLYLHVRRDDSYEDYYYHYFLVEIY